MFDDNLLLFSDDDLATSEATVAETGTAISLPQGFPYTGLAVVALVQTAGGDDQDLVITLQYSIDGTNYLDACVITYGPTQSGVRIQRWAANLLDLVSGGFDTSLLKVRVTLAAGTSTSDWDRVYVYLTPVGY
jgi:hypothetical protein